MTHPTYRDITPEERRYFITLGIWFIVLAFLIWR